MSAPRIITDDVWPLTCISALVQYFESSLTSESLTTGHETFGTEHRRSTGREVRELRVVRGVDDVPIYSRHRVEVSVR